MLNGEPMTTAPRLLFLGLVNDVASDRIVAAMARLGARCAVMSAPDAFAARTRHVERVFALPRRGGAWVRSLFLGRRLAVALRAWQPDLVIPIDELSARSLRDPKLTARATPALRALLAASLGDPRHFSVLCNRHRLVETAAALGIATPEQVAVRDLAEARRVATMLGYPVVLKREQTCGGAGVAILADEAALDAAFAAADAKARAKRRLQRLLGREVAAADSALVLQRHVVGRLAFRVLACKDGRVLEGVSFLSERVHPPVTGASTMLAPIERPDVDAASAALVGALKCSGLVSVDFILPEDGPAVLIEMNPRPVASGHLGRLFGHDVLAALLAAWGADTLRHPAVEPAPARVALFPRELDRDPAGALADAPGVLHDVPWDDPASVAAHAEWLGRRHPAQAERLARRLGRAVTGTPRRRSRLAHAIAGLLESYGPASAK